MAQNIEIMKAEASDIDEILDIYSYYVLETLACLDEFVPSKQTMLDLLNDLNNEDLPFYVCKVDGKVAGYCYAKHYRVRSAYRFTVETSIYIDKKLTGKGIAQTLFEKVVETVKSQGYKQMVAVVVNQNSDYSNKFHKNMGFIERGKLEKVGFKFNKWLDIYLLQKEL